MNCGTNCGILSNPHVDILVNVVHSSIHPSKWCLISSFLKQIQTVFEQTIILIYYIVLNIALVLKLLTVTYCLALHQPWDSHAQQKNYGENGSYEGWDPVWRFVFFPTCLCWKALYVSYKVNKWMERWNLWKGDPWSKNTMLLTKSYSCQSEQSCMYNFWLSKNDLKQPFLLERWIFFGAPFERVIKS